MNGNLIKNLQTLLVFLDEMNAEFAKTYGLRVLPNKGNGGLIATDLQGNKVI